MLDSYRQSRPFDRSMNLLRQKFIGETEQYLLRHLRHRKNADWCQPSRWMDASARSGTLWNRGRLYAHLLGLIRKQLCRA